MPPLVLGLEPHPAMDRSLLLPPSASKPREKGSHYPSAYLKSVTPLPNEINRPIDAIGYVAMKFISLVSSLLAWWLPLWLVETSPLLSTQAWLRSPAEVIFLRRILILESLSWAHGLVAGYLHHLKGILSNTDNSEIVLPLFAEFQSHRVHLSCFLQSTKPSLAIRWFLVLLQALSIPPYFLACVIYSPLCHATARFVANLAVCLYTTAIERYEHHELVLIRRLPIPPVARHFYGLQEDSDICDVLLNIRADDMFHQVFNEVCASQHCCRPCQALLPYISQQGAKSHSP